MSYNSAAYCIHPGQTFFSSDPYAATQIEPAQWEAWQRDPTLSADDFRRPDAPTGIAAWNDRVAILLLGILLRAALGMLAPPVPPSPTQSLLVLPTLVSRDSCAPPRPQGPL